MDVSHLLTSSILHAPYLAASKWGDGAYGPAVRVPARVTWSSGVREDGTGEEVITTADVMTLAPLSPRDRVWLPSLAMVPPLDVDGSDAAKSRTVENVTPGMGVDGAVAFYCTTL